MSDVRYCCQQLQHVYTQALVNSTGRYHTDQSRRRTKIHCVSKKFTPRTFMITVWTVVQTVLTATSNSYGYRQISTHHKINTPEPIDKKFGTIDYVREGTSYTKFGRNPFTGGFWANGLNITKIFIYLFIPFFLWSGYRSDPWMDFYAR